MANSRFGDGKGFDVRLPEISFSKLRYIALAVLVLLTLTSSFYTVQPEEQAVVLRFGSFDPDRVVGPGLHFKLPLGIDEAIKVPVQRQLKQEFGFRTTGTTDDQRSRYKRMPDESNMLTGDLNAADVEWVVQYRIADPEKFLFRVRNVEDTLADLSEAVMREVVGDRTVNEVITVGRTEIGDLVHQKLQALADHYESGLIVDQVVLQDVNPPERVKPSFNEVNQAEQEREQKINVALKEKNQAIPQARGQGQQMVEQAEGYAIDRVNRSQGEAARFESVYAEYRKAPEVTRTRLYLEAMNQILPKMGRKLIIDEDVKSVLPLLNLEGTTAKKGGAE
jgi:membrane protease subunit HflK